MVDLPRGAVTFLFTDIEGSTRLVKQLRERYGEVVADHQRLLRAAFVAHDGHEIDTQGDSFFVAFASAREALLAAVEGQLALVSHPWPEGVRVTVRMGLHTGQAVAADGRYTGLAVHRAARICAAGHGGQILVSQATQTLLEDEEEDLHVFLRDLGEQRLKDLDRPVRLYQAATDGLPAQFPPLRHEAQLAQAAEAARRAPVWRRPGPLALAALAVAGATLALVLLTRGGSGGLRGVHPNSVGVIDPRTNHIVAEVPAGIRPGPVAVDRRSVWIGNLEDRTLTRIDARSRTNRGTISLDNKTPTGLAYGAGALWVAEGLLGRLARIDLQFHQVTKTVDLAGRSDNGSVAVGGGSVWAVYGESTLARIEPASVTAGGEGFAGASPAGIVFARGSVWVANSADATVQRFYPGTFEQGPVSKCSVGRLPVGIAFGAGSIWVADAEDDAVTRIEPSSCSTFTIRVGKRPSAISAGSGAVWVASAGDGTVSRIDPGSNEVVKTVHVGNAPSGIAVGDGAVWVTVQAP